MAKDLFSKKMGPGMRMQMDGIGVSGTGLIDYLGVITVDSKRTETLRITGVCTRVLSHWAITDLTL